MIITISGDAATGTTTLAKHLSHTLKIPYQNAGIFFREYAEQHHVSLLTLTEETGINQDLDKHIDASLLHLMQTKTDIVIEGRLTSYLAWKHQIKSFRILLTATPEIQAQRLAKREYLDLDTALAQVRLRDQADWARYLKLYGISKNEQDHWNDLIIATDKSSIEQVYNKCLTAITHSPLYEDQSASS